MTMARIKFTGYIDAAELEDEHRDDGHESGLSEEGYDHYVTGGRSVRLSELDDITVERVDE